MSKTMSAKGSRIGMVVTLVGMFLFAFASTAFAAPPDTLGGVGQNGPTPPKLGDPVATQSEVQWITVNLTGKPSGTYTLGTDSGISATIGFTQAAGAYQKADSPSTALTALYGAGTISVVGGPTSPNYDTAGNLKASVFYWRVMWVGIQAGNNIALMTANSGGLTNASVTVDPYRNGQTFSNRVQPHGGYSAGTDYCVQCHQVHGAANDYALLAQNSVTATCQTCHSLFGSTPGSAPPGGGPAPSAPTSLRAAYEVSFPAATHGIGSQLRTGVFSTGTITQSGWSYGGFSASGWSSTTPAGPGTASDTRGGLYCADCHTPHGDFGQLVNSKYFRSSALPGTPNGGATNLTVVQNFVEDAPSYAGGGTTVRYLHFNSATTTWQGCTATGGGGTCTDLTTTDAAGQSAYLYGYKLLSAYPNHSWADGPESWNMDARGHDGARWCGRCHDLATPIAYGGTAHSHPTGCTTCHGNPNDGTSTDFPHTSTFSTFLKDYPDLLCINCHTAGSLP